MNKINEIISYIKNNKNDFNKNIFVVLSLLIVYQSIFTLILPLRINIFLLISLIGLFVFFFIKIKPKL
ncbi:MAG: hypothetical protein RR228_00735 [Bacilli bacterium]